MLRSDWFFILMPLGCLGLATLALADRPYEHRDAAAAYASANPAQLRTQQGDTDRGGMPRFAERFVSNPNPVSANEKEARDLAAQEASAVWAFYSLLIASLSAAVTAIGTILLYQQIVLTRKAVAGTGEATDTMRQANDIAKHNARTQARAYFSPIGLTWTIIKFGDVTYCSIRVVWKNHGATPTRNLMFVTIGTFDDGLQETDHFPFVFDPSTVKSLVGSNQEISSMPVNISLEDVEAVFTNQKRLFLQGRATYQDIFGDEERNTTHLWLINFVRFAKAPPEGENLQEVNWTIVGSINDAT